jgi:hypothetical protein
MNATTNPDRHWSAFAFPTPLATYMLVSKTQMKGHWKWDARKQGLARPMPAR